MFRIVKAGSIDYWYVVYNGDKCSPYFFRFEDAIKEKNRLEKLYNGN